MHVLAYDFVCMFEIWPAVARFHPHERTEGLRPPVLVVIGPNLALAPLPIDDSVLCPVNDVQVLFYLAAPFTWLTIDKFLNPYYTVPADLRGRSLYAQGFCARDRDWAFPMTGLPVVRFMLDCR